MALKDILVHLDATEQSDARLRVAAALAQSHGAHLTGLHVVDLFLPAFVGDPGGGGAVVAELMEQMRQDALADAAKVEAAFRERLRLDGLAGEWRQVEGPTPETVMLHARYADLTVVGQEDPEGGGSRWARAVIEAVLFSSGRPVLIVPYAGRFESVGRKVVIGWNASREAARAINDAIPLIARADSATVLVINPRVGPDGHGEAPGTDIAVHLARHGVKVEVDRVTAPDVPDGELLLNRVAESGADLLVVGGYGHSRMRELVLGGVTRTLLRQMTLPVLMSH
ncbi:MAG: universal stress protein [Acetobacteraceae bacterium]|nr:universal stress protein [Acetobacteraceae bacterium]